MTRDDRIVMVAIATTFALSARVMAAIVVKGSANHDRFFFGAVPLAAADRRVPARATAIPARSGSIRLDAASVRGRGVDAVRPLRL
ncbi:hypothetical protein [Lysobacter capsici]|uniref:hypothetical protein n=1 Tax=Lysobacter capsici TaxID=435897 RepID=UPI000A4EB5E8|nr:hypothetical protein [Lysobacter capsici]